MRVDYLHTYEVNRRAMEDFEQEYFQLEMGRAITEFQNAQAALLRAKNAATVDDKDLRRAWTLVMKHTRSASWLACTLSVAEAVGYLPTISPDLIGADGIGEKRQ
jgi:hypothetical protein